MSGAQYAVVWFEDLTLNVSAAGPFRSVQRAEAACEEIGVALLDAVPDVSAPASVVKLASMASTLQRLKPTEQELNHGFLPVNGHPDDDECTHRADGTDATYCGEPEAAHQPTEREPK